MHRTRFSNAGGGRGDLEPQGRRKEAGSLAGVGPFLQTLVWVQGTQPLLPAEEGPWIPEEMSQRPSEHPSCSTSWKERGTGQGGGVLGGYPVHELLQAHRHAAVPQDENPHCWPPSRPRPPRCSSSSYEAARGGGLPRDLSPAAVTCYSHITCARENPAPPGPPLPTGPAGGLGELAQVPL